MAYQPIEDYGVIGNMRTVALVGRRGSIDWLCWPHFDAPSIFAALLDDGKGGRFSLQPEQEDVMWKQFYWPGTNVLITRFLTNEGVGEIEDFMPAGPAMEPGWHRQLVRRVKVMRGRVTLQVCCEPAFDYARAPHEATVVPSGAVFRSDGLSLALGSSVPLLRTSRGVHATFSLREGETAVFVLRDMEGDALPPAPTDATVQELFDRTVHFWRHWLRSCSYQGRWREMVHRSALVLKLLTFEPTGAIVAAPTCSLPEQLGGVRNWDYRYTWMRDAAFTVYGLLRIGFREEAAGFMNWIDARCREVAPGEGLQIVYGIDGRRDLTEVSLPHLEGYRGSRPVRIGNGASSQLQLDIYGELMDAVYLYNKYGAPVSYDTWTQLRNLLHYVCDHWKEADEGIWEVRNHRQQFVYSKLMCWVAVDRGLRLADKRSFPGDRARWYRTRDEIYESVMAEGWNPKVHSFVQAYGSDVLDASNLIMPLVFFLAPNDPRMLQTLEAIRRKPEDGGLLRDGLVYRYDLARTQDGVTGTEGTFNMCSFWLVEAMTRAGRSDPRMLDEARLLFERMLGYANHLGLYSEETGPRGEALGNFPQAFAHLALISAAFNLDRELGRSA